MNKKIQMLVAATAISGATLTGGAVTSASAQNANVALPAVSQLAYSPIVVRPGRPAQLRRIAAQIRRLTYKRRALISKYRALRSGRVVAVRLTRYNCRVTSARGFRYRLVNAVRSGRITPMRARIIMRNTRAKSYRCQGTLRYQIRRTNYQIARLKRLYAQLLRRPVIMPRA
ncbi:MAG: hypothetical protein AAF942_17800 [Pseudomonadota bacterium]